MRSRTPVAIICAAFLAMGCIHAGRPSADQMERDVSNLTGSFATLEVLRIAGFRNQDWCRFIDYPRGAFTNLPEGTDGDTCNLFSGRALPFDDQALADFERVRGALAAAGWRGRSVTFIEYDAAGRLRQARFDLEGGAFDRWSYVFEPAGELPEQLPGEVEYTRITPEWYFEWEDWN